MLKLHPLHKVKTTLTTQSRLLDVESAKSTRVYIRFPIFYCLLEFCKVFNLLNIVWDSFPDFWH